MTYSITAKQYSDFLSHINKIDSTAAAIVGSNIVFMCDKGTLSGEDLDILLKKSRPHKETFDFVSRWVEEIKNG